jgi:hypothetical protein
MARMGRIRGGSKGRELVYYPTLRLGTPLDKRANALPAVMCVHLRVENKVLHGEHGPESGEGRVNRGDGLGNLKKKKYGTHCN